MYDTIGVYEFDTIANSIVDSHLPNDTLGALPHVFGRKGHLILLLPPVGASNVRVLKAGDNCEASVSDPLSYLSPTVYQFPSYGKSLIGLTSILSCNTSRF